MISVNYVNNNKQEPLYLSPIYKVEREIDEIMNGVEAAYQEYVNALNMYDLDATFLEKDNVDSKKKEAADNASKNFVSNLGASVINIFKKAIAFITDLLSKIKEKFGGNKEKFSKAAAICNQNPKLKGYLTDEVKKAIDRGDMSVTDLKALAELDRSYEELVKLAKKKDIDPNSLRGKWEAAKKKFESIDKVPIIAGAVTIAGIIVTMGNANDRIKKSKVELSDATTAMMDWDTNNNGAGDLANKGYFRILADAGRYIAHQHIVSANESNSITVFLANLLDSVVDKVAPKKADSMRKGLVAGAAQNKQQRQHEANAAQDEKDRVAERSASHRQPIDNSDDDAYRRDLANDRMEKNRKENEKNEEMYQTYYQKGLNNKGRAKVDSEVKTK